MPGSGYTYVCEFDALKESVPRRSEVEGVPVGLVPTGQRVFAIHDVCSHSAVSLSEGEVDGFTAECRLHASRFAPRTGQPLDRPATRPVPVYPVEVEDGGVYAHVVPRTGPDRDADAALRHRGARRRDPQPRPAVGGRGRKGTLFRRFGDRDGLLLALLDEAEAEFQEAYISGPPPLGPEHRRENG